MLSVVSVVKKEVLINKLKKMKNDIKEVIVIIILLTLGVLMGLILEKHGIRPFACFSMGTVYMFLVYSFLLHNEQPDTKQEIEIMYFEKTSELQEWTEKLKKEEVEVIYYGTVWNALVKHRDMIAQDKVNNYCIIYKYN